jgi:hypothetical protein
MVAPPNSLASLAEASKTKLLMARCPERRLALDSVLAAPQPPSRLPSVERG